MGAVYTYVVADLVTGVVRDEIPFSGVRYGKVLNGPGSVTANIDIRHPKATRGNIDPGRTALYVLRNGAPVWGGIIWTAKKTTDGNLAIGAEGFWSYFRRRNNRTTQIFTATEQTSIALTLINSALAEPGGNLAGMTNSGTLTSVVRDRTYAGYERKAIGEAVEQLAGVINGFDFAIETTFSSGVFTNSFNMYYPQRGRRLDTRWEVGVHCDTNEWEIDATKLTTRMEALGAGEADTMLIAAAVDAGTVYPILDDTVSYKDVNVPATLADHANEWLVRRRLPTTFPSIGLLPTIDTEVGSFIEGDEIFLMGNDGFADLDSYYRIISYEVTVSDEGDESTSVVFQGPEAMP